MFLPRFIAPRSSVPIERHSECIISASAKAAFEGESGRICSLSDDRI
jgi:hypothetical protein